MIDARYIAEALGTKSKSDTSWLVPCPVREHRNGKVRITDKEGKILVYCLAGCDGGEVISALKSKGLWPDATEDQKRQWRERKQAEERRQNRTYVAVFEADEGKKTRSEWAKYWKCKRNM